ncbi:MAG TPA: hypothetical protein VLM40_10890 [Gemmata sp.]|nr:hypothetical protein [Gemmata sp.]
MQFHRSRALAVWAACACLASGAAFVGCEAISNRLSKWKMLDQKALEDPIRAVGGSAIVFSPAGEDHPLSRDRLAKATPLELVAYYSPVLIQQRVNTAGQKHPYPPEYDLIGSAQLRRDSRGEFKATVGGAPAVYAIYQKLPIGAREHVQLTYTAWYPAHPRMKTFDVEAADIDSCVLRLTLDEQNAPVLFETIAACGCFHKAFVEKWVEEAAGHEFGMPEKGKKYAVERTVKDDIDWEVAGIVDEPREHPRRPVVFLKAGEHKVIGMGSTSRLRVPAGADVRNYSVVDYAELYHVPVEGSNERAAFFDLDKGGKVRGAERKERFIFSLIGVDAAGQPRANDQIKLHFDQSTWSDPTIYSRFLRLPRGAL